MISIDTMGIRAALHKLYMISKSSSSSSSSGMKRYTYKTILRRNKSTSVSKTPLLFLGANGFPGKVYTPALNVLLNTLGQYDANIESFGEISSTAPTLMALDYHQCFSPLPKTWAPVISHITDAAASLSSRSDGRPIIAIGHSAGGALLLASLRNAPHLYKGIVMIDPPLFNARKRYLWSLAFALPNGVLEKLHPLIKGAVNKRDFWSTLKEAEVWIDSNRLFKTFHPDVRRSFLSHGLVSSFPGSGGNGIGGADATSGLTLAFTKRQEANMYLSTPMEVGLGNNSICVGQYGRGGFPMLLEKTTTNLSKNAVSLGPRGVYFYSQQHKFSPKEDIDFLKSPLGLGGRGGVCDFVGFEQGHFWPLEEPSDFGVKVAAAIKSLDSNAA